MGPIESSTLLPKIHRKSMLPAMCRIEPCMNMAVNTVVHAGMVRLEEFLVDGRVDLALLSEVSRSRLILSTRLAQEEMVLVTRPGTRPPGIVSADELSRTPLILGDGLRAAMETLLAGRGIELQGEIELNDHETIRLMVQQGVGASILPHRSVYRCGRCNQGGEFCAGAAAAAPREGLGPQRRRQRDQ